MNDEKFYDNLIKEMTSKGWLLDINNDGIVRFIFKEGKQNCMKTYYKKDKYITHYDGNQKIINLFKKKQINYLKSKRN